MIWQIVSSVLKALQISTLDCCLTNNFSLPFYPHHDHTRCKQCGASADDTSNGRHDAQLDLRAAYGGDNIGLRDTENHLGCDGFQVTGATGKLAVVNGW
jgi:hypothetical protein